MVNVSTSSVPTVGETTNWPGCGALFTITVMLAKAYTYFDEVCTVRVNESVDPSDRVRDGRSSNTGVVPTFSLLLTGVNADEYKLSEESLTLQVELAVKVCSNTEPSKFNGSDGLVTAFKVVKILTRGSVCCKATRVTVAVDDLVLSYTVTVTTDVVFCDDSSIELS
jgi:hypothetical protein